MKKDQRYKIRMIGNNCKPVLIKLKVGGLER